MRLADLARDELNWRLAGPGLAVRTGPFVFRARTDVDLVQDGLALLYADYPVLDAAPFADYHVSVLPSRGPRRWFRPQVHFALDEFHPFRPFPRDHALPLFEWGLNWSIATTVNQYLMIHSAVIERGGRAVILPAPPGSGKSTLCAALIHRGWRLLSDELALVRLDGSAILPLARPISLKNRSIEIIRDYLPEAVLSPRCEGTAKGTVALLKAPSESVARKQEPARPAWIVFPKWQAGAEAAMTPRSKADTFLKIGENAFNYSTLGRTGFESLARVVDACACSDFIYSRLDDAVAHFEALAAEGEGDAMTDMVAAALRAPESLSERSLEDWDLLVRQARAAGLLARLCLRLEAAGLIDRVPEGPRDHLVSARVLTDKQGRDVRWEARCVVEALRPLGIPVLFLKGAAYVVADLPAAAGRLFSDVDVLVPRDRIDAVEETLARNGWAGSDMNDYDQQYYRRWTHQIPPMAHIRRQVTLDVHHTIVPQTARIRLASDSLLEAARPLDWPRGGMVLAPTDMVLHSATHLFNEGEFDRALRDLSDLDVLMRHFAAADAGFWTALVDRAAALDLVRPAAYALRYTRAVFDTPVPDDTLDRACRGAGLFGGRRTLMDLLFKRMLVPNHASSRNPGHGLAQWLLYVRSHHIRMPLHILLPHLARKAWRRQVGEDTV